MQSKQQKPQAQPTSQAQNSAAAELKALQKQMAELTSEVTGLRGELNKKLLKNPSDVVAYGVLKSGLAITVLVFVLRLMFG